jgi:hypothetical protein
MVNLVQDHHVQVQLKLHDECHVMPKGLINSTTDVIDHLQLNNL